MKLFKESIQLLKDKSSFSSTLDLVYAIALTVGLFVLIGYFFIYKPIVLFILLIAGMLVMGWFMLAVLFPNFHAQVQTAKRSVIHFLLQALRLR